VVKKTKGIVLRTVKYGETSIVVTVFTELFGVQTYLVNGIRAASKKGSNKTNYFQPSALLDLVVYHNDFKNLQRIKEYKWVQLYQSIFSDVIKNSCAVFIIELLLKCLKEPEQHADLFLFAEDALIHLDNAEPAITANFPLFFALHMPHFFGFGIEDKHYEEHMFLDLQEGVFTKQQPEHFIFLKGKEAEAVSDLLKIRQPEELADIKLSQETRRHILIAIEQFYAYHLPGFGSLKTLPVLRELTS
jgi:DNA repair protein RecO (recombination protein O)